MTEILEPIRFDTKIAVLLHEDLEPWQALNVTAFLISGIAADKELIGDPYEDADGTEYLAMIRQPVVVFAGGSERLAATHAKAVSRELAMTIYTREMFATGTTATTGPPCAPWPATTSISSASRCTAPRTASTRRSRAPSSTHRHPRVVQT